MTVRSVSGFKDPDPPDLRNLALRDPIRWSYIVRATGNVRRANSVKEEWLTDEYTPNPRYDPSQDKPGDLPVRMIVTRVAKFNYQQIFRNTSLDFLLDDLELMLRGSQGPWLDAKGSQPYTVMGGTRYYLGRVPNMHDTVELSILRDLHLLEFMDDPEWLLECTVIVRDGGEGYGSVSS